MISIYLAIFSFVLGYGVANDPFAYAPKADRDACVAEVDSRARAAESFESVTERYRRIEDCLKARGTTNGRR